MILLFANTKQQTMISDPGYRDEKPRVCCNLCGSNGASVRCDKCQSQAFCLSCDDMYHRHPKRRYHLRKAVALDVKSNNNNNNSMIVTKPQTGGTQRDLSHSFGGHPSKMPVPPPRRKRKGLILSSIKDTFASTGQMLRRFVSNERLPTSAAPVPPHYSTPSRQPNRSVTAMASDHMGLQQPLIQRPIQTIRPTGVISVTQLHQQQQHQNQQNQTRVIFPTNNISNNNINRSMNGRSGMASQPQNYAFSTRKLSEPLPAPPPPPRPQPMAPQQPFYENHRKTSLPMSRMVSTGRTGSLGRVSTSIGDLTSSQSPSIPRRPTAGIRVANTLDGRRPNWSLHDLNVNRSIDDIPTHPDMAYPYPNCPFQYQYYHHHHQWPQHQSWTTSSLNNSIEDMNLNPSGYEYDSDASGQQLAGDQYHRQQRASSMKRCHSAAQMYNYMSGQCSPIPPPPQSCYPYPCYGHPCGSPAPPMSPMPLAVHKSTSSLSGAHRSKSFNAGTPTSATDDQLSNASSHHSSRGGSSHEKLKKVIKSKTGANRQRPRHKHSSGGSVGAFSAGSGGGGHVSGGTTTTTTSSSRRQSDFDDEDDDNPEDEENYYSVTDNDSTGDDDSAVEDESVSTPAKWSCRFCTFINDRKTKVCEMCCKTRNKKCLKQPSNRLKPPTDQRNKIVATNGRKTISSITDNNIKMAKDIDLSFDDKIISEQLAIEKELIRRLDNERRVDRQNQRIARKEEYTRRRSLGLPVSQELMDQIRADQLTEDNDNVVNTDDNKRGLPYFDDHRRPSYPPGYPGYGGYGLQNPLLAQNPSMNPLMMNPLMNPMTNQQMNPLPHLYATNPMHNMYAFNANQSPSQHMVANGSQTSLDRFGYSMAGTTSTTSSVMGDHSYINPLLPSMSSRYSSCENLPSISSNTSTALTNKSHMESGLQLIQLLRDADRKGYTADDVEVAINFSPEKPLDWLDENWHNMCETVMTLTNNQIMQNETRSGNKRLMDWNLLTEAEAKKSLRATKGNIWQSIERSVKSKQQSETTTVKSETNGTADPITASNGTPDGDHKTSLSLQISGVGSGKDNNDSNQIAVNLDIGKQPIDPIDIKTNDYIEKQVISENLAAVSGVTGIAVVVNTVDNEIPGKSVATGVGLSDHKVLSGSQEQLLSEWRIEKQLSDRRRQQEREREKMRKILELQKRLSEFDTDLDSTDSTGSAADDLPLDDTAVIVGDNVQSFTNINSDEIQPPVGYEVQPMVESETRETGHQFIDSQSEANVVDIDNDNAIEDQLDGFHPEYYSDELSDLDDDEFDQIDARIQRRLEENYGSNSDHRVTEFESESNKVFSAISGHNDTDIQVNPIYAEKVVINNMCDSIDETTLETQTSHEIVVKNIVSNTQLSQNMTQEYSSDISGKDCDHNNQDPICDNEPSLNPNAFGKYNKQDNKTNQIEHDNDSNKDGKSDLDLVGDMTTNQDLLAIKLLNNNQQNDGHIQETNTSNEQKSPASVKPKNLTTKTINKTKQTNKTISGDKQLVRKSSIGDKSLPESAQTEDYCLNTSNTSTTDNNKVDIKSVNDSNGSVDRKTMIREIDKSLRESLEEIEQMEEAIDKSIDPINVDNQSKLTKNNKSVNNKPIDAKDSKTTVSTDNKLSVKSVNNSNVKSGNKLGDKKSSNKSINKVNDSLVNNESNNSALKSITDSQLNIVDNNPGNSQSVNPMAINRLLYDEGFGWARTDYECELCCMVYPIEDLVAMISCTHSACRQCLSKYLCVQIRERQRLVICCPFCDEPAIDPDDDDKVFDYLALFDQIVRCHVPQDVYELFQRKCRDRALMRDPNFQWCAQCSSGFIAPNLQALTLMCPDCKNLTCTKCNKKWKKQHFGITCAQFAIWEMDNDPAYAEQQLDKHLKEFGIDCPNCKFKYQLAKGGCMHFRCIQCSYDFCGGCQQPFKMGIRCGVSPFCEKLGLHSHHPRNCLFYLRDKDTQELQSLLDKNGIQYKTKLDSDHKSTRCPVMEQKDTDNGMRDQPCGRYVENAGLCRLHYKEYLGDLIWKAGLDPIQVFNLDELELVLKRENIKLPSKNRDKDSWYDQDIYKQTLVDMIIEKVPLKID